MAKEIDNVFCPMLKQEIELGYCVELQWIADGGVKSLKDEEYLTKKDFQVCKGCKKRIDPGL